jgi:hypothetical protein
MEETRNVYIFMVETPEEREPLGRPRGRWENDVEINLKEMGRER